MKLKKIISAITAFAMTISLFTVANASSSTEKPAITITFDGYEKVSDTTIFAYVDITIDMTAAETLEAYSSKLNMTTWEEEIEGNGVMAIGIKWTMPVGFSYAADKSAIPDGFEINTVGTTLVFSPKSNPKEYLVAPITTVKLAYRVEDFSATGNVTIIDSTIDGINSTENSIWNYSSFHDTIALTNCSIPAYNDYSPTMSVKVVNVSDETFSKNTTFEVKISYSGVPVSENDYDWAGTALSYLQFSLPLPGYGQYYVANGQYYEIDTLGTNSSRSAATNLVDSTYKYAWVGNSASASAYRIGADNILTLKFVVIKDFDKTINFSLEKDATLGTITYNSHGKLSSTKDYQKSDNTLTTMSDYIIIESNFQVDIYRANYLMYSDTGITMEKEYFNFDTPANTIVETAKNSGLDTLLDAWELVTGSIDILENPSKIADYTFEQQNVYEAIIMDLLEASVDYSVMDCINNDITKDTKDLTDIVINNMKTLYNIEILSEYDNLSKMDANSIKKLQKTLTEGFKKEHGNAHDISKISNFIDKTIEYATDLETYIKRTISFYKIVQLSDSMKSIVNEMYAECPPQNLALKSALMKCSAVLNLSLEKFADKAVADFFCVVGENVAEALIDELWEEITTQVGITNPSTFAIMAAYKAGHYITNKAFNTDATAEKYYKLATTSELETLIKNVYSKTKYKYQTERNSEKAKIYNSMVDFMFKMLYADCQYSIEYLKETGDTILGNNNAEETIEYVNFLQTKYHSFHERVLTDWILTLPENYPTIYLQYAPVLKESIQKRKSYYIQCPVDVYIYDKNGNLVGSVVDNVPYCRDTANLTIAVDGDKKTIYLFNEDEYDIVYKGNDIGTMDIEVTEYDESNSVARNVYFNNLILTDGLTYTSTESGTTQTEDAYVLVNETEESVIPDYDSLTDSDNETHTVTIERGYFTIAMAVSQELHKGENVEITAYIPEGYEFVEWISDANEDIFDDKNSSTSKITIPDYDVNIVAKLIECPTLSISSITDSSVTIKAINCSDITDGTIILAIYDANGVLEQLRAKDFTEEITFTDLELENGIVKVMLWDNSDNLIPLTKSTQKLFYFETATSE